MQRKLKYIFAPIMDEQNVLLSTEVELFAEALETFEITDIASARWHTQHEHIEKLNMQAILNATRNEEEYVKEAIIQCEKLPVLVSQLITTEIWRQQIFNELIRMKFDAKITFSIYFYHEACIINLLETLMFHEEICTSFDDYLLDLIDYSYRILVEMIHRLQQKELRHHQSKSSSKNNQMDDRSVTSESMKELVSQEESLRFDMAMKILSIVRYVSDCLPKLPISVTSRLLDNFDFVLLLVEVMELKPWEKMQTDGSFQRYIEGKWQNIKTEDRFIINKTEGQVWLALYQLLLSPHCVQKYEYTEYKKNRITKLRSYMNDVILDQMPNLIDLQRFLEQLSFMEPPLVKKQLVIEQVTVLYERIINKYKGRWHEIAEKQANTVLNPDDTEARKQALRWADTMNFDILESFINESPKCAICGHPATKRCSRCQREWYCRRECQVQHWPKHKPICEMLHELSKNQSSESESTIVS
ncbi:unnamed protein product [Didymodactylos carnosus]|uniref:Zinc finger MYND domain-containing protein 10 n=1 Tax=Didymodactylos carnosus TaxID=1234261 RepID=A0A813SUL7_9BILA|nr:unnamed protein product [Didymodactylos carnosus]CAF0804902.1 unnamed protein product [Didymodactylos carnosus]CAF3499070.1 unnamed protein product [Didymodactylos carnosus]CAF3590075.1 unnamed protein product [Didymodactylos carnosus]